MKICCGNPLSQSGQFRSAARIIRISAFSRRPSARMIRLSFKKGDGEISLLLLDMAICSPFRRAATSRGNDFACACRIKIFFVFYLRD